MKEIGAIGILGGMGPQASAYMYQLLIELSIENFRATNNDDFPEIVLHSIPVPDFISNKKEKGTAFEMLKSSVERMNELNISYLSVPCNTAHLLLDDLRRISKAPLISMIDQVVAAVKADKVTRVGVLGAPCTLQSNLYQDALHNNDITSIVPSASCYDLLEKTIRNVLKGTASDFDAKALWEIALGLREQGAEGIVLGCTELPLVFPFKREFRVYDSVEVLSMALLESYYGDLGGR